MEIIKFIFSGFWVYLGFYVIVVALLISIYNFYNRTLRHRSLMKHGYPPSHCDGDGEIIKK